MRILIAEDDAASRLILRRSIQKLGYECEEAENGDQAWELFLTMRPNLIISDWMMPGGDGVQLCEAVRSHPNDQYTYFIILTALADKAHTVQALEAGADDYLVKPLDPDELQARLQKRMEQLEQEAQISALPPVVMGALVVVPVGLILKMTGQSQPPVGQAIDTTVSAAAARSAVMEIERRLGFEPVDRETEKLGYDIESRDPQTGKLRFIEVKGRISGAATITVTRNEILYSLNKPEDFILAIVEFTAGNAHRIHYVRRPFQREPDFGVTSVNYDFGELLARAGVPR